jgi:hypothetical protein
VDDGIFVGGVDDGRFVGENVDDGGFVGENVGVDDGRVVGGFVGVDDGRVVGGFVSGDVVVVGGQSGPPHSNPVQPSVHTVIVQAGVVQ